jgi:hypothetical protein
MRVVFRTHGAPEWHTGFRTGGLQVGCQRSAVMLMHSDSPDAAGNAIQPDAPIRISG